MYKEFLNNSVNAIVTTRSQGTYECRGVLTEEDENTITLTNVRIGAPITEAFKNSGFFNGSMQVYKENVDKIKINKEFIVFVIPAE